jgi:hypothetical protein
MLSDGTAVSTAAVYRSTGTGGQLTNHADRYGTRKEIPEMQCCRCGMNIPDHISESLETIFWVNLLKFFDADTDLGSGNLFDPGSGMKKKLDPGFEINIPESATLHFRFFVASSVRTYPPDSLTGHPAPVDITVDLLYVLSVVPLESITLREYISGSRSGRRARGDLERRKRGQTHDRQQYFNVSYWLLRWTLDQ